MSSFILSIIAFTSLLTILLYHILRWLSIAFLKKISKKSKKYKK
nr:MAG TPA: hypothetical protein [Caudoviricetes sp.]DAJ65688.1 MAG TPA: hypothetical protein [Bacteriophage sp.]DAK41500.1 MAG TPA: hypothetical protein [Caudoviricetes sp.]